MIGRSAPAELRLRHDTAHVFVPDVIGNVSCPQRYCGETDAIAALATAPLKDILPEGFTVGLLDSLFGGNTAAAQQQAAQNADALIGQTQANNAGILTNAANTASGDINTGASNALGALFSNYGNAQGALTSYLGQAQGALHGGVNSAVNTVQGSNSNFQPAASSGTAATGMLSNALGLNGASGDASASSAFTSSPGYQYSVDQATQQAQRAAAAGGILASGNTLAAVSQLGSNLANQNYQQYLSNLSGLGSQGLQAASGISGNNQAAGGYQYGGGITGANLDQSTGSSIGTLDQMLGNNSANIDTGQGTSLAGIQTGLGNSLVSNNWTGTGATDASNFSAAQAQDKADSANNGLLIKALGSFASPITGQASKSIGGLLSSATGGFL